MLALGTDFFLFLPFWVCVWWRVEEKDSEYQWVIECVRCHSNGYCLCHDLPCKKPQIYIGWIQNYPDLGFMTITYIIHSFNYQIKSGRQKWNNKPEFVFLSGFLFAFYYIFCHLRLKHVFFLQKLLLERENLIKIRKPKQNNQSDSSVHKHQLLV